MEPAVDLTQETPAEAPEVPVWKRLLVPSVAVRVVGAMVVLLVALVFGADYATSSPRLCQSCHEMAPATESWQRSAHVQVKCVRCHQDPHPWYSAPQALVARGGLLSRDAWAHVFKVKAQGEGGVAHAPITDAVCLQCHDPGRKATSGFRILINHKEHAKRNKSCVSCHLRTAHPEASKGKALSLMAQCFNCHGTAEQPKASPKCELCHPKGFDLKPQSHKKASWKREHSLVARMDRSQCNMCHQKDFCSNCHGIDMPHPKGWTRGDGENHSTYAKRDRKVCDRCHGGKPNMCTMCHHKTFDPNKGPWVDQHFVEVRKNGAYVCIDCHGPLFCVRCHVGRAGQ